MSGRQAATTNAYSTLFGYDESVDVARGYNTTDIQLECFAACINTVMHTISDEEFATEELRVRAQPDIRSKQRDPNPEDTSLIRKDTPTYMRDSILRLQQCFLIKEFLLGLGSLCLLLNTAGRPSRQAARRLG